ncbi:MAG: glycosyltransferase family 2 protein [Planctomycetes bacterium]|nr:glycosyltransferase family 2 protein [Planctomycetota bacterium]
MDNAAPRLSVVIVTWNVARPLRACLLALRRGSLRAPDLQVIVVDNASDDDTCAIVEREFPEVELLRLPNACGYSAANNAGADLARGRWIALLNPDTEPAPFALERLVEFLDAHPGYGAAGPMLRLPTGSVQLEGGRRFPTLRDEVLSAIRFGRFDPLRQSAKSYLMPDWDHRSSRDVDVILGACIVMRRDLYQSLGGLDEGYSLCGEDVDLCRRVREAGLAIRYVAEAEVLHLVGASSRRAVVRSQVQSARSIARYYATWGGNAARVGYALIARGLLFPKLVLLSLYRFGFREAVPGESLRSNLRTCLELLRPLPGPARR